MGVLAGTTKADPSQMTSLGLLSGVHSGLGGLASIALKNQNKNFPVLPVTPAVQNTAPSSPNSSATAPTPLAVPNKKAASGGNEPTANAALIAGSSTAGKSLLGN